MTDYLLELGANTTARRLIKQLGLPLPLPQPLARSRGPWVAQPLRDTPVAVGAAPGSTLAEWVALALVKAGAEPAVVEADGLGPVYTDPAEAYGRPVTPLDLDALPARFRPRALVFDASGLATVQELRRLYDFFHPLIRRLARNGRVVLLGRSPEDTEGAEVAAAQAALNGFVRSLAKEIGRKGATAQLVVVDAGSEDRLEGVLRFLLSRRSAFVSGQPFHVSAAATATDDDGDEAPETPWVQPLAGQTALVTGAARGIGAAIARRLAEEGAHVVGLDRPQDAQRLEGLVSTFGGSALTADVADPDAPDTIAAHLNEQHGGVDIVVHNAGVTRDRTLGRLNASGWDATLDINLGAVVRITDRLLDDVLYEGGRVLCLSSIAGIAGNMGQTNYAASKAGLIGWVGQLAAELAPRGITVNAVAPGFIETRMTAAVPLMIREAGRRMSALGQGGLPLDVAEVITWLATPGAHGITGQVTRICGGMFLGA